MVSLRLLLLGRTTKTRGERRVILYSTMPSKKVNPESLSGGERDNFIIPSGSRQKQQNEESAKVELRQKSTPTRSRSRASFSEKVKGVLQRAKTHSAIGHRFNTHRSSIRAPEVSLQSFYETKLMRMWSEQQQTKSKLVFVPKQKHNLIMSWVFGFSLISTLILVPSYAAFYLQMESNFLSHFSDYDNQISTFMVTILYVFDAVAGVELFSLFFLAYHDDASGTLLVNHTKIITNQLKNIHIYKN